MKKLFAILKTQTIKDSMIVFVGLGATAVIGFVYTVVLARVLGPNHFGIYSAITALATIVYSLGDLGIVPALINYIPKHLKEKYQYITTGFWLQFGVAILILLFFAAAAYFHNLIIPGSLMTDLLLAGSLSVNYLFINFAQGIFTAERRFWSYSVSQIIDASIKILLVFLLLRANTLSIETALGANIISTIFALFITFGKELYRTEFEVSKVIIIKIYRFAKWIAVSRIFSVMLTKIDIILLNILAGSFQAGIYSAAARVAFFFALLISSLGSVVNPRFSSFEKNSQVIAYIKKLTLLVGGISAVMVGLGMFADPIIGLVYGNSYSDAINIFRYLTIAMVPFMFTVITTPAILYTYDQPAFYAKVTAVQVVGIIVFDYLFIPTLGPVAPVIAMGITNIFVLAVSLIKLKKLIYGKEILERR